MKGGTAEDRKQIPLEAVGKRAVRPTTVMINGQPVKRSNNYEMSDGANGFISVFDSELAKAAPAERSRPAPAPPAAKRPKPAAKPREPSAKEKLRLKTNESIRADAAALAVRRALFFHEHRALVEPFTEAAVLEKLAVAAAGAPPTEVGRTRRVLCQPEAVTGGEMRDYQLAGLDWMAGMYQQGVNPILVRGAQAQPSPPCSFAAAPQPHYATLG